MSEPDMKLPEGKICMDCVFYDRCFMLFGCDGQSKTCDWSPSRFQEDV